MQYKKLLLSFIVACILMFGIVSISSASVFGRNKARNGFLTGVVVGGAAAYLLSRPNSPTPASAPVAPPQVVYPACPNPVPIGYAVPCIPSQPNNR